MLANQDLHYHKVCIATSATSLFTMPTYMPKGETNVQIKVKLFLKCINTGLIIMGSGILKKCTMLLQASDAELYAFHLSRLKYGVNILLRSI